VSDWRFWELAESLENDEELADARRGQGRRHRLADIIVIALSAAICGADSWVEVEMFGLAKESWFRERLELAHGIPSHDTFGRVFSQIDPVLLMNSLNRWIGASGIVGEGGVIALDGKTVRRSHDREAGRKALHLVSAWATEHNVVLGQRAVEDKSNEITAIPEVLELIDLDQKVITIDAIGTQTAIAAQIIEGGGDYVLALKDNHPILHKEVRYWFSRIGHPDYPKLLHGQHKTVEKGHGRIETRIVQTIATKDRLSAKSLHESWKNLQCIIAVHATRRIGSQRTHETRFFISSLPGDAEPIARAIRSHWSIENSLHWTLDMAFREDESRIRSGNAQENMAALRRIALSLLKRDTITKAGIKAKRLKAGWDHDYLLHLLAAA
jgi:predicted transposase YbfD/YdcC